MATKVHCAYAFECLAASFERRQPLSLAEIEELWEQYHATKPKDSIGTEDGVSEGEDREDVEETDVDVGGKLVAARPAAIAKLLNQESGSASSASATSSSSSLPSTKSTVSSTPSSRQSVSAVDTPGNSPSSFSLGRRRRRYEEYPLFVTWNTISRSGYKSLRGCIGTFVAQELEAGLHSYALTSAFEDERFSPIPSSLLPSLSNQVTLLTNFSEPTKDPMDWTLGKHGIRISFSYHSRRYGATYLPDVAKEQGWTKEETLISLMRKAGWGGSGSAWLRTWRDGKGELVRYEGKQVGLRYDEWRAWRDWVDKIGVRSKALN